MKKISKATGNIRFSGNAGIDSICFRANKVNGTVSIFRNSVVAQINEKGDITCADKEACISEKKKAYKVIEGVDKKYQETFKIASIITFIMSIVIGFININLMNVISALFLLMWACYFAPGTVGLFIEKMNGNEKVLNILRFHSAEHAAINAYQDLSRAPTLEEIRKYSNYSYNCGSLTEIKKFTLMSIFSIVSLLPNAMLVLVMMLAIVVLFIFIPEEKFFFMQFLVTANPTDREYKVAIKGIEYALQGLNSEEKIEVNTAEAFIAFMDAMFGKHKFSEEECNYCANYNLCKKMFGRQATFKKEK